MLMNYVQLEKDIPLKLHFTDHYFVQRLILDPTTGRKKSVKSLVFWVDEENGQPVAKTLSILSEKLSRKLQPYLAEESFKAYDFVITKKESGFTTDFVVDARPRTF